MTAWWAPSFDPSCLHHPVASNRVFSRRVQIRPFVPGFPLPVLASVSLWGMSVVSGGDFGGPVSASKNSVPGGQGSEQTRGVCRTGARPWRRWQQRVFGACAIVADSTQALRTDG